MKGKLTMDIMLGVKDVKGVIADLLEKLGGDDSFAWFTELKKFLRKEPCWGKSTKTTFSTWKTIKLGIGVKSADYLRIAIKSAGMHIGVRGNEILDSPAFTLSLKETEVDLVVVSNDDLGFKEGARLKDTYARALEFGLELCPSEVGPQLRLQYPNQPIGELLLVAMEPIVTSGGFRNIFDVERFDTGKQYLDGSREYSAHVWYADARFVFCRHK